MNTVYSVRLFGQLAIIDADAVDRTPTRRKEQALLAYLALNHHPITRDRLLGLLWPDLPTAEARNNLRVALSRIKRQLPASPPILTSTRQQISLNPEAVRAVDTRRFFDVMGTRGDVLAEWERLDTLYQDDFLAGFYLDGCAEFDEWVFLQREHCRIALLERLDQLVWRLLEAGETAAALAATRKQLAFDPLREQAHRQLMQILADQGQAAAALQHYEMCVSLFEAELGVPPSQATTAVYEQIHSRLGRSSAAVNHNLQAPLTPFFGRTQELNSLFEIMADQSNRLVTICGVGGIGKSRLATEFARQLVAQQMAINGTEIAKRVYFVPLLHIDSSDEVATAIASAMDLRPKGSGKIEQQLQTEPTLLILDNFEHVLQEGPTYLWKLLTSVPNLRIVTTSRVRLAIQGEVLLQLNGLPVPSEDTPLSRARHFDASMLFIDRARRFDRSFRVTEDNWLAIGQICRLLDGMPLGIELATMWINDLSVQEIAEETAHSIDFLAADDVGIAPHHRSVRGVFEQSWQRLTAAEQQVLAALSVMSGPFSRRAAQAVSGVSLSMLRRLHFQSLLRMEPAQHYSMHELIRQFSAEKLRASHQHERVEAAHASWYMRLIATYGEMLQSREPAQKMEQLRLELNNIRAAWHHSIAHAQTNLLADGAHGLTTFYTDSGSQATARRLLTAARQAYEAERYQGDLQAQNLVTRLLVCEGNVIANTESYGAAAGLLMQARKRALKSGLRQLAADATYHLGRIALHQGDSPLAHTYFSEVLPVARDIGDARLTASALRDLGNIHRQRGEYVPFLDYLHQAYDVYHQAGDQTNEHALLVWLGVYSSALGKYWEGRQLLLKAQALQPKVGTAYTEASILGALGHNSELLGDYADAVSLISASITKLRKVKDNWRLSIGLTQFGSALIANGAPSDAQPILAEVISIASAGGIAELLGYAKAVRGVMRFDAGDLDAAQKDLSTSAEIWQQLNRAISLAENRLYLAQIALLRNDRGQASELLDAVLAFSQHRPIHGAWHRERFYGNLLHVARALDYPQASAIGMQMDAAVQESAAAITDARLRQAYLSRCKRAGA